MDLEEAFAHAQQILGTDIKIPNNVIGIISVIVDIVEEISSTIKSSGVAISGPQKLKLAFDLTEKITRHLESRQLISKEVADKVIKKSNKIETYSDTVSSVVDIIKSHGPKIISKIKRCCC